MKYFKTECKNLFLSPKRLFYVLVFPLVIFGFFAAIFYKGVPRDLPIAYGVYQLRPKSAVRKPFAYA